MHHGAEKVLLKCSWSADQEYIAAGSADRFVTFINVFVLCICTVKAYTFAL